MFSIKVKIDQYGFKELNNLGGSGGGEERF